MLRISTLRDKVRAEFGDHAASNAVFNEAVINLRREGKVRLIPPADPRDLTERQFEDSIPNTGSFNPEATRNKYDVLGYIQKPRTNDFSH